MLESRPTLRLARVPAKPEPRPLWERASASGPLQTGDRDLLPRTRRASSQQVAPQGTPKSYRENGSWPPVEKICRSVQVYDRVNIVMTTEHSLAGEASGTHR